MMGSQTWGKGWCPVFLSSPPHVPLTPRCTRSPCSQHSSTGKASLTTEAQESLQSYLLQEVRSGNKLPQHPNTWLGTEAPPPSQPPGLAPETSRRCCLPFQIHPSSVLFHNGKHMGSSEQGSWPSHPPSSQPNPCTKLRMPDRSIALNLSSCKMLSPH